MRAAAILLGVALHLGACYSFQTPALIVVRIFDRIYAVRNVRLKVFSHPRLSPDSDDQDAGMTRRMFADDILLKATSFGSVSAFLSSSPAQASGGATAGGAYLLSAKQRYNKRVLAGIKSFLSLDASDLGQVNAYFASSEEGGWEDLSAAGYLLSNAFRTSSTKAPDALPSVKKMEGICERNRATETCLVQKE